MGSEMCIRDRVSDVPYDVDTVKIKHMKVQLLPWLCHGMVDICGRFPNIPQLRHENDDLGACIISSPVCVFVEKDKKTRVWPLLKHGV